MKADRKKPCAGCPWRRVSINGWLGDETPEGFVREAHGDGLMPCHRTVDYEDPDWMETLDGAQQCAGMAIYRANVCKNPRHPRALRLEPDRENVFATPQEFIDHHSRAATYEELNERRARGERFGF